METRLTRVLRPLAAACAAVLITSAQPAAAAAPRFDQAVVEIKASMMADPARAIDMAREASSAAATQAASPERARQLATLSWLQGEAYGRAGNPAQGLALLTRAQGQLGEPGARSHLAADILLSRGSALIDLNRISEALKTLQRAHDLFVALRDERSQAKALTLIAILYGVAGDHEASLRYYAEAAEHYGDDPGLSVATDNGRATELMALGRAREAEPEFRKVWRTATTIRSAPMVAQSLGNIALAQMTLGNVAAARATIDRGLKVGVGADAASVRLPLIALAADAALRSGDVKRAATLIDQRFAGVDLGATIVGDRDAHEIAYRVYRAARRSDAALDHFAALKRLDDQATDIARSTSAALAAARFDYANQELRITQLKAAGLARTVTFQRETARTQRLMFLGVVGSTLLIIALLAIGLATIRRSRNQVRSANDDLAQSNVELNKALRAKSEFLATTSHEIRTPLNGILGMTQVMIADGKLNAATRDRLSVVHGAGMTMRALVNDILDMAKIESGRLTVEAAPLDLHATVSEAARLWREPAEAKGLAFDVDTGAVPRWIMGDEARLRQIVFNLLSNAVKFTAAGTVSLRLGVDIDTGRLRLDVTDTGVGIAPDVQEMIFESFRQADAGTTRQFGGTGLGLSICRNLARAMDGDVTVESRPGEGATFRLDLPLVPADAPQEVEERCGLLIVERNPITRAMLRTLFDDAGPVVFAAADDAAEQTARVRPLRILVDEGSLGDDDQAGRLAAIVEAADGAPVALLHAATVADQPRPAWHDTGVADRIMRPVAKKALVNRVMAMSLAQVRDAA